MPDENPRPIYSIVDSIQRLFLVVVLTGIRSLPLRVRSKLGGLAGKMFALIPTSDRRVAELQLQRFVPGVDSARLVASVYSSVGQTALEALRIDRQAIRDGLIDLPAQQDKALLFQPPRPTLFLSAHIGNWDLLAAFVAACGVPLTVIGRQARNPIFQEALVRVRENSGVVTIWRDDPGAVKSIVSEFKSGRAVAALLDQDTVVRNSMIPFFGTPAATPVSIIELGLRYQARIVSIFAVRVARLRYEVVAEEISGLTDVTEIAKVYHQRLEALILRYPEQWVWFHKRWRTLANGQRLSTRDYIKFLESKGPR